MSLLKKGLDWVGRNLSNDSSSSSSRVLQTLIVLNVVVIVWLVVAKANWTITDNVRLIVLTLITAGAGSYIANKLGGPSA